MEPMDSRQWPEPPGASANLLPHWASLSPNGESVAVPWLEHNTLFSQPYTQGFIPAFIGAAWTIDVQNQLDQSAGVVTASPPTSHLNYNEHCNVIASVNPTFNIRRSLSYLVPQRRYTNNRRSLSVRNFNPEPSIYFKTFSGRGFPMKDALNRNFKSLMEREDPMLPDGTAISLRFEFEGYESWTCQVKTRDSRKIPRPIPRGKLAYEVAKKLRAFLKKRKPRLDETDFLGGEAVSLNSVNVKHLALVRLDHVSKSSWQPQFEIVRDA